MTAAVVGAGIVGACCAIELASAGADVTLFEQFDVDHDRGSSFGDSRIIRLFYDDPYYTALMTQAFPLWRALEHAANETLYERFGGLYFAPAEHPRIAFALQGLAAIGVDAPLLDASALRRRFPAFRFDDDASGIYDEQAGSLRASRCVRAAVRVARDRGVELRAQTRVAGLAAAAGGGIELRFGDETRRFDVAVVCAGPWAGHLLPQLALPVRVTRQQYIHLEPTRDAAAFEGDAMPIWIDGARNWYGFPRHGDVAGVKIASHDFGPPVDPDDVDRTIDPSLVDRTRAYARERLPALADGAVTYAQTCLYTVSPDEDFIVDAVDGVPGCAFVAGCSGHAFKFGPLLGAVAADLATGRVPRANIARFRADRFRRDATARA